MRAMWSHESLHGPLFLCLKSEKNRRKTDLAKYEPGQSGNPNGRPEGSKNKNAMRPVLWWNMFLDLVEGLPKDQQAKEIKWALEQMMPKIPVLPGNPTESLSNGLAAQQILNGLAPIETPVESNPPLNGNGSNGL